jgi:hypothetical protein
MNPTVQFGKTRVPVRDGSLTGVYESSPWSEIRLGTAIAMYPTKPSSRVPVELSSRTITPGLPDSTTIATRTGS